MKKGKKIAALLLAMATAGALAAGLVACGENQDDPGKQEQPTAAEKLKDGGAVVFTDGTATIDLSQYVRANGNVFSAQSSNRNVATVTVAGNVMTVTAAGEGTAIITVACGDVRLTFSVAAPKVYYTITLDGTEVSPAEGEKWEAGASYTLPAAKEPTDANMEFKGWSVNGETKQAGEVITVKRDLTITAVFERKAAQEVSGHAQSVSVNVGKTLAVAVSDYIAAYGREVSVSADGNDHVTFTVQDGVITLSGVAQGTATLTLSTEGVTVTLNVTVLSAEMPSFENGTINIDLFTETGKSFAFVPTESSGHTYSYVYTLITQDAKASIADGKLTYTPGADYELEGEVDTVALEINVAVTVDGVPAGNVSFTVTVRITDTTPAAPVFENVTETIDPFSSDETENSYTLALDAEDDRFVYTYSIGGNPVTESKTYNGEAEEIVTVKYVYKGNTQKSGTAEFTVKVSYDKAVFPALVQTEKTADVDLALVDGGIYSLDLFANFTCTENIASYTVNGAAHTEGKTYTISNENNAYGETATEVVYTVVATIKNNLGTLTYTYTVNVSDTSAFRMENGGFENGLSGWTGANGSLSSESTYWGTHSTNNDGQYYVGIDGGTETIVSPSFRVGGSGWITFKFGSARPTDHSGLRNIRLEFYEKNADGGADVKIADVRNILFQDPQAALKLNDYKLDLSDFIGKTVYAKAVDGEDGGDFRSLYLDAFETYWKAAPTDDKYTDLTSSRYMNASAVIDFKDTNTVTLDPFLSQGLLSAAPTLTAQIEGDGLTADATDPLCLTATKKGNYTVTYSLNGSTAFTASVVVTNSVQPPEFEEMHINVKKGESGTLQLPAPASGSRFSYAYAVADNNASIENGVFTYAATAKEEGTYSVRVTVTVTDEKWGAGGDTFEKEFTVKVTVYGEKIVAGDLLADGKATLSLDAYAVKAETPGATSASVDFAKYLNIPENVSVTYAVTRKIGDGEATSVTVENGVYSLSFADCDLTANQTTTVTFAVTATNAADPTNTVSFTVTVSVKDTTVNRVENGGFETGDLTGWTLAFTDGKGEWSGNPVQNTDGYWGGKATYNKSGNYHFNGQENGIPEDRTYRLTSSMFLLGGSGFITFKLGGHAAVLQVYVVENGAERQVAEYANTAFADHDITHVHLGAMQATMTTYVADLSDYIGKEIKLVLCDNLTGDWGHSVLDEVVTYYETAPDAEHGFDRVKNLCDHTPEEMATIGETVDIPWRKAVNEYVAPSSVE